VIEFDKWAWSAHKTAGLTILAGREVIGFSATSPKPFRQFILGASMASDASRESNVEILGHSNIDVVDATFTASYRRIDAVQLLNLSGSTAFTFPQSGKALKVFQIYNGHLGRRLVIKATITTFQSPSLVDADLTERLYFLPDGGSYDFIRHFTYIEPTKTLEASLVIYAPRSGNHFISISLADGATARGGSLSWSWEIGYQNLTIGKAFRSNVTNKEPKTFFVVVPEKTIGVQIRAQPDAGSDIVTYASLDVSPTDTIYDYKGNVIDIRSAFQKERYVAVSVYTSSIASGVQNFAITISTTR